MFFIISCVFLGVFSVLRVRMILCLVQVLHELLMEPKLAYSSGLTPESLPKLVENTPAIAYEILLRLTNSDLINDYLQVSTESTIYLISYWLMVRLHSTAMSHMSRKLHFRSVCFF